MFSEKKTLIPVKKLKCPYLAFTSWKSDLKKKKKITGKIELNILMSKLYFANSKSGLAYVICFSILLHKLCFIWTTLQ